jgi:hypothetical protein
MFSILLRPVILTIPLVALLSTPTVRTPPPALLPPGERFVAEAVIQEDSGGAQVYLPITYRGQRATLQVVWTPSAGEQILLLPAALTRYHIMPNTPLGQQGVMDITLNGATVRRHVTAVADTGLGGDSLVAPPGLPPVIGWVSHDFMVHYDVVIDGPARRVRFYDPPRHADGGTGTHTGALPAGVLWRCVPAHIVGEDNLGFPVQVNGHPMTGALQTIPFPVINLAAAKAVGLTQHSPTVQPVPDSLQTRSFYTGPELYTVTDLHVAIGAQPLIGNAMRILGRAPLEERPGEPFVEITLDNLLNTVVLLSRSTQQACLGVGHTDVVAPGDHYLHRG